MVIEVPHREFLTAWKPNRLVRSSVFDKFAQGADAVWLADNVRMQSKIHDAACFRAFGVKLVEACFKRRDAFGSRQAPAGKQVEALMSFE